MREGLIQVLMSFAGSFGFGVLFHVRGKKLLLAGIGGALSWGMNLLLVPYLPSEPVRYFFSAFLVAVYAEILARILRTPTTTFLIPSIIPNIPGGSLYHTMRYALSKDWYACLAQAVFTLKLALGLALGIIAVLSILNVSNQVLRKVLHRDGSVQRK